MLSPGRQTRRPYDTLTDQLVAEGHTNAVIGAQLCISARTVGDPPGQAMKKLGLRTPVELVLYALRRGIVPQEQ